MHGTVMYTHYILVKYERLIIIQGPMETAVSGYFNLIRKGP